MGQPAFAVIRQDDGVAFGQQFPEAVFYAVQHFVCRRVFEIQPDELLVARHDAQFDGGVDVLVAHQHCFNPMLRHQCIQAVARFVVANDGQQDGLPAQRGHVARHIRRPARAVFGFFDFGHRDGGFGRNTGHVAEPIAVEHHVAHHQYTRLLQAGF